jgi:serine/threonine protein kinase
LSKFAMAHSDSSQKQVEERGSTSARESLGGSVSLYLRLWSYGGPSQLLSGLPLEQDPEIAELVRTIIRDSKAVAAVQQTEMLTARFDNPAHALLAAKTLQQRFLTFQRKTEPQQIVPSILISATPNDSAAAAPGAAPGDMLANVTSAQILVVDSIYERVKNTPGFQFNPKPVREAGQTGETIYELLWTDESTYGHLREASGAGLETRGRYEIKEELGRGAMGAVYKAYDRLIKRTVALKTISINRNTPDRDELIERLKQEARAAGGLDHPNIITIYDVGQEDDAVYLSMQFLEGKTLLTLLTEDEGPSLSILISWADQILSAVGFAHARGVIHRDLKPANLMLTSQDIIKVLDFGIAKIENASLTQTGLVVGTPSYMAPEQVAGKKIDHRADIFALGSVFYELVTREKPFRGDVTTILYKIMHEDPVAPSLVNPAIPGGIDAIIRKALAKDPKERFQTCEEMRDAFLEQAALLNLMPAASASTRTGFAKSGPRSPVAIPRFLLQYNAQQSRRIWPGILLALAIAGTTGWAFYTKSLTGSFPPLVTKLMAAVHRALEPEVVINSKPEESTQPVAGPNNQTSQNGAVTDGGNGTSSSSSAQGLGPSNNAERDQAGPEGSGARLQETAAVQSSQPGSDSAHAAATGAANSTSGQTQAPQSSSASGQPAPTQSSAAGQAGDNQPAAEGGSGAANTANGDSAASPVSSDTAEDQTAGSASTKPLKKSRPDPALTIDGFTRRDVPELMRQADAAAGRGDYRLARYEYELILKLDPGNSTARAGLHRVQAAEQSH